MTNHCRHCESEMAPASDASTRSLGGGHERAVPASWHFLQCVQLDCRARGPRARTAAQAETAFRHLADTHTGE